MNSQHTFEELEFPTADLRNVVLSLLRQIPVGSVSTYGDLARALGDEKTRSARWLGEFLKDHPHSPDCPCHRIVRSTGEIGLHISGDPLVKVQRLEQEGTFVSPMGTVDVTDRFTGFNSPRPLEQLREFQMELGRRVRQKRLPAAPRTLAGVDVAYRSDGTACGAYVLLDAATLEVLHEIRCFMDVDFPYIPGYLTYREMPVMLELCRQARNAGQLADVIFCDGNGRLHPWRAGIAVCLGVVLDHPVIGIGKSLLCGTIDSKCKDIDGSCPVIDQEERVAMAVKANQNSKAVYVSVGNRITLAEATLLARQSMTRHRVPEPIYFADRLTKQLRRTPSES
jgi:deoxyribonuclease V